MPPAERERIVPPRTQAAGTFKMDEEEDPPEEEPPQDAFEEPYAYDDEDNSAASASARLASAASASARLATIWDCPQLLKFSIGADKRVWTCGWCRNESDGTRPKPFLGWNATKAISHVCRIPGMCIRLCSGTIPPDYAARYKDLYLRQVLNKEKRSGNDLFAVSANEGADADHQDVVCR